MRVTKAIKKEQLRRLQEVYRDARPALHYTSPFTLLVATILSAQCTDERVNVVTARLFPRLDTPEKMVQLTQSELEGEIHDCGLFRSKAKHILAMSHMLIENYGGEVPEEFDELIKLPGVGRKTANVLQAVWFGRATMAVDTHVYRVAHRLGLVPADANTPYKVELSLKRQIPDTVIPQAHHWLLLHGRYICQSARPKCARCPFDGICPKLLKDSKLE